MNARVRRSVDGPYPWWVTLSPPPPGFKWVYLTNIDTSFDLVGGGKVSFPMPYLEELPRVQANTYWQHKAEIDAMIDEAGDRQKPGKWVMPKEPFLKDLPTLAQHVTDFWWEGQKPRPRIPCKLAIVFFGESVQVSLNDEEKRRSMHTTAQTVSEALQLMEERLTAGAAPWRSWGPQGGRK